MQEERYRHRATPRHAPAWALVEKPEGATAELETQSFGAGIIPDVAGTYVVEVVGVDSGGVSEPVTVTITAQ